MDNQRTDAFLPVFEAMTNKQREVLGLVADNFTSKEIAYEQGVSESAVNQRLEAVRTRAGSPPRAELARAYRSYVQSLQELSDAEEVRPDREKFAGKILQLPLRVQKPQFVNWDNLMDAEAEAGKVTFDFVSSKEGGAKDTAKRESDQVPEVLDGGQTALNRILAIVAIAGGILLLALVGLGLLKVLSDLV